MTIHHATLKKAEKMGIVLTEVEGTEQVRAFWPKRSAEYIGASVSDAMQQMQSILALYNGDGYRIEGAGDRLVHVIREDGMRLAGGPRTPFEAHQMLLPAKAASASWEENKENDDVGLDSGGVLDGADHFGDGDHEPQGEGEGTDKQAGVGEPAAAARTEQAVARSENGVALDGAIAYREGTPAGDNPYTTETDDDEEYNNAVAWDEAWDAAADEQSENEPKGGSVVNEKYRAIYAERGHPEHCGDWLADIFNNFVKTKTGTDIGMVDAIAAANGVDNSKYDRTRPGWQGRLRMTTRNLLARVVWLADGVLRIPGTDEEGMMEYKAPGDWMANQRFKKPKVKESPAPEAE